MRLEFIDAEILTQSIWVARLQTAIIGINREVFDVATVKDDTACAFGRWLQSESALSMLGQNSHMLLQAIHATFHEVAGTVAEKLNQHEASEDIQAWYAELNDLSRQHVKELMRAKKRLSVVCQAGRAELPENVVPFPIAA